MSGSFQEAKEGLRDLRKKLLVAGSNFRVNREPLLSILGEGSEVIYRPHIDLRAADGTVGVWQPSMSDVLANDWQIVTAGDV